MGRPPFFSPFLIPALLFLIPAFQPGAGEIVLMAGTELETVVHVLEPAEPGAKAGCFLVVAGIHGDEPAGVLAARELLKRPLPKVRLLVLPEANRAALTRGERQAPGGWAGGDLNRLFPGRQEGTGLERLAWEIFNLISSREVDMVLDLHESSPESADYPETSRALIATFPADGRDARAFLLDLLEGLNDESGRLREPGFTLLSGAPAGSLNRTASLFGVPVITVETAKDLGLEERVALHLRVLRRCLEGPWRRPSTAR